MIVQVLQPEAKIFLEYLQYINLKVRAIPVFTQYDNEKMYVIYSLFGLHNHNLGSSLSFFQVILFGCNAYLGTFSDHRCLLFLLLTPEDINKPVESAKYGINTRHLTFKIVSVFCFLFCFYNFQFLKWMILLWVNGIRVQVITSALSFFSLHGSFFRVEITLCAVKRFYITK